MKFSADRLVELRRARGLTRDLLAHNIGVSRDALAFWEQGRYTPRTDHLARLAEILNVAVEDLFERVPAA